MAKKSEQSNEFYPKCPLYTRELEICPSSKTRLQEEDMKQLLGMCVTEKYKTCKIFMNKGKEQAA